MISLLFLAPVLVHIEGHAYDCGSPRIDAHGNVSMAGDCYRMAAALFVHAPGHQCRVPTAAYDYADAIDEHVVSSEMSRADAKAMERFGYCLCGPEGTVDWDPRPHKPGGYFAHPSCNRNGWNGHRYVGKRR